MYTQKDLDEMRTKYSVSYDIVTHRLENPTYRNPVRRDRMKGDVFVIKQPLRLVLRRDIAVAASEAGLEPIEVMMRVKNYASVQHINVSDRNRAELLGVVKALATPAADRSTVQQIMVLQATL